MNNYIVYKHTSPSGKFYIGITGQDTERRWRRDGSGYKPRKDYSCRFYNAILKYGWDNFKHEILYDNLTKEEAEKIERELIDKYDLTNPEYGYNMREGGGSQGHLSDETKNKISESRKGKNCGNRPPEVGKKISQAKLGHIVEEEVRQKISENLKGRFTGKDNGNSKAIRCIETNECFECARDACKKYNINPVNMCAHLKGRRKSVNKLHFEYIFTNND